ncbi:unnamed protein product [Darwinula stevensoni]|uniref:HpcH/HpaI aldolase/citrate lyase domain-containing protein n=1 Tax=Darwinula stevensoni TaxID=69355 RepID=A0A7R9AKC7_9CRUS|nr:unnamed protein product [Darwinula stevensoni]CAG0909581.1 unnamed protein product [Darwinula stevensoni]
MSASPLVAEATAWAGFDWAVVDMEHTPLDMMEVVHILQALSCTSIVPITRIPTNDAIFVKRVMDAGARTLMFPFVENAMQAQQAVAAMKYPPQGIRGMAAMGRASRFGTVQDYFKHANACVQETCLEPWVMWVI